jgi:hypothetical protein
MDKAYCRDDEKPATITVSPAGGKITDANGDEVPGVEDVNGTFTFIPRKAGPGTFTLVYTVNGVASAPAKITVIDTPEASTFAFNSVMKSSNVFEVTFTPDIQESGFEYAWTFGAGFSRTSSAEQSPVVEASLDASGAAIETSVTLQVSNGKCPAEAVTKNLAITGNGVFDRNDFTGEVTAIGKINSLDKLAEKPVVNETPAGDAPTPADNP